MRSRRSVFLLVSWLFTLSGIAHGQATAQLDGTVRDESGGVLPGVTVTVTQTDTGFTRSVVTETNGSYVLSNLPTGPYRLEVSLQGFRTYVQSGIVLQVGGMPTINVVLAVGNLQETVSVQGAAPLVDVRTSGIRDVVEQAKIVELPLQGRNVTDLIMLAGSAVNTGKVLQNLNRNDGVAIAIAGGLRTGVAYTLDGAMNSDFYDNTNLPFPFPDALQEFSVATSGQAAANGMHSAASVNAVTKSGTNNFHGNAFEFLRDSRFNAPYYFAPVGADGKKQKDGLNRNQFGGTLGGPVVRDRLFFFGAYQRTRSRQMSNDNLAFVPTAAMMAGDFTTAASPACNNGRQVALRAPFVNNRVDPSAFSPAAVKIMSSGWIPSSSDPCGQMRFAVPLDDNNGQGVARADYQMSANHQIFGRYLDHIEQRPATLERTHNLLVVRNIYGPKSRKRAQTTALGDTMVFGSQAVNAIRATYVRTSTRSNAPADKFFDAPSLGIPIYTYVPGVLAVNVTNGFAFSGGSSVAGVVDNRAYQAQDDFSKVTGGHQLSVGANVAYATLDSFDYANAAGNFAFNGSLTGIGLGDFLTGQASTLTHGTPSILHNYQWYVGVYGQDAWRASDRLTLNFGLRWEPYFGTVSKNGAISNFVPDNFNNGVRSTVFLNAPPGLIYPGDLGFPKGKTGLDKQWMNLAPRIGLAWDVTGTGRFAIRSSYGINYDRPTAIFQQVPASGAPFGNRLTLTGNIPFDDPYRIVPGGQLLPVPVPPPSNIVFPGLGSYASIDPDINSTRAQSWNVTVERQLGSSWQVAASYLGTYLDHIWGQDALNPGIFMGLGPCTLRGVSYPVCSTVANTDARRVFSQVSAEAAQKLSYVSEYRDIGTQNYRGFKLSFQRRAGNGLSLGGNYTVSHCTTDTPVTGNFVQFNATWLKPGDASYDRGNCPYNQREIANFNASAQAPQFSNSALRIIASNWRVSGILNANSGNWLTVTTTQDRAFNGIPMQRVDQVSGNPYGDKTLLNYLNAKAFAIPAAGTLGNEAARSIEGPGFWKVDVSVARILALGAGRTMELRIEAFNLFNNFNWGDPNTSLDAGTFGQINTQTGDPRIMQFAIKYGF
jgi:Carboxypeptidase regulatory-like domain